MAAPRANMSYRDIKQVVLDRIHNKIWAPDSLLPSETDLAEEFSSTRTTVNRALRELAEEGYLERKRKAGTRVLNSPVRKAQFAIPLVRDEITENGSEYRYALVERTVLPAPAWLCARMDIPQGLDVLHLRCMHYAGSAPFQYEVRWIVPDSVPDVLEADFSCSGPNDWLVQKVPFTNLELSFLATKADQSVAEFLGAQAGDPIFTAERITWLRGQPVTLAKLFFAPGYRMTANL
ncbi:GntR family transcriptional regulator [Leisingera sp. SS27]|uniref:GntR family transcriptional regulator n=1 Tax=Leisingera sp. SS27 TaxID=2979462 RepID=UPI00232E392A|nr:GntR family transcriptional regulator [Leisingera sp. SS27]MDC0656898.1 GntR family transcriptional regulator [Leisingera sp. SS27]